MFRRGKLQVLLGVVAVQLLRLHLVDVERVVAVLERGAVFAHQLRVGDGERLLELVLVVDRGAVPEGEAQVSVVEVLDRDANLWGPP